VVANSTKLVNGGLAGSEIASGGVVGRIVVMVGGRNAGVGGWV
jgi:hypothetical protein